MKFRRDRATVKMGATPIEVRPGGYKVYRGVAAFGDVVLDYPEFGRSEFVPAKVALDPETVRLTEGVPFTIVHPDDMLDAADEATLKSHDEGSVLRAVANWEANPPELVVDVIVHTASAQEDIESGRMCELSLGYECDEEERPGVHNGKAYQVVQVKRRPNHLSGVRQARAVTPDGRRARLDEAAAEPGGGLADDDLLFAGASYAHSSMADIATDPLLSAVPVDRQDADPPAPPMPESDALPPAPGSQAPMDAPPAADLAAAPADPAVVFAALPPEDVEVLKMLSPESLAMLAKAMQQVQAETVEQAVMSAPPGTPVEVEVGEEPEGESEGEAPAVAGEGEGEEVDAYKDATVPAAPQSATSVVTKDEMAAALDAFGTKMIDMFNAIMAQGSAKKADAAAAASAPAPAPAPAQPNSSALAEQIRKDAAAKADAAKRMDAEFVAEVRKWGYRVDSYRDAAVAALGTIKAETPDLEALAVDALKHGRRADFLKMFAHADRRRRDGYLDAAGAVVSLAVSEGDLPPPAHHRDGAPQAPGNAPAAPTLPEFHYPARAVAGA